MKNICIVVLLAIGMNVYGQQVSNSLDLAYPPYTPEQKSKLMNGKGLYFVNYLYPSYQMSGQYSKGSGYVYGGTSLQSENTFFLGTQIIPWEEYYRMVGLQSYVDDYYKTKSKRNLHSGLGISGLVIGELAFLLGGWDLLYTPYGSEPKTYTFGTEQNTQIATWGGLALAVASTVLYFSAPPKPQLLSRQYLAQLSNTFNNKLLE